MTSKFSPAVSTIGVLKRESGNTGRLTFVVLYQLLHGVKLGPGGDVVAPVVQLADLIVLDVVALVVVPVADGQREGT